MAETNDRQQELEALHRSYKMMEMDRQKYSEESQVRQRSLALPPAWVVRGRGLALGRSRTPCRLMQSFSMRQLAMAAARTRPGAAHAPWVWLWSLPAMSRRVVDGQNIIKRQRQAIEKIRKENERLKEQLKAESQQNANTEGNTVSVIAGRAPFFVRSPCFSLRCGLSCPSTPHARGQRCAAAGLHIGDMVRQQDCKRCASDTSAKSKWRSGGWKFSKRTPRFCT
jgi:hypothetical protein